MSNRFLPSFLLIILTSIIGKAQDCNNLTSSLTPAQPTCGLPNGSLTVNVTGGTSPYTYNWNNGSSVSALSNLSPAGYTVTVSDINGCTTSNSITLNNSVCPKISTSSIVTNITQTGATVSWPAVPCAVKYRVLIKNTSTSAQTTKIVSGINQSITLTDLQANTTYQIRIRTQCSQNGSAVSQRSPITSFTTLNSQGILCLPPFNIQSTAITPTSATIIWQLTPGAIQYNLRYRKSGTSSWSTLIINGTSNSALLQNLLQLTNYEFQIRSKCNNNPDAFSPYSALNTFTTATDQLAIVSLNCSNAVHTGNLVTCKQANGVSSQIPYTSTNVEPYQVQSANSTGVTGLVATLAAGNLNAGSGMLTVSISGTPATVGLAFFEITIAGETCTFSREVSSPIINPDSVKTDTVFSCTEYTWNGTIYNESGTYTWNGLTAGGCDTMAKLNLTIQPILVSAYNNVNPSNACGGSVYFNCQLETGALVSGGSPPYSFIWNNGGTTEVLQNLCAAGMYSVTATDIQGCSATATTAATFIIDPTFYNLFISGPSSTCSDQVPITLTAVGGNANLIYVWSNGATTQSISVVQSGTYSVSAYTNECALYQPASRTITIREASSTTIDTVVCSNTFTWNGTTYTESGIHIWTGTNTVGCDSVVTLNLILSPMSITTFDNATPENICFDALYTNCQYSITSNVGGGQAPYSYLWSNGATTSINNNLCVAGTYELLVTDAQGCTQNTFHTAPLSQPELINVSISGPVSICNTSGPAILTANGGNAGSIYDWSNGATTQSVAVTQSGTYSVSVYGFCYQGQASKTITIREASSTTIDTVVCSNTFTWNGTTYTESGIHIWTGTNTVGCDSLVTLNLILSPMSITTFDNATPENICFDALYTNCQYSITSNVGGGQAPYSYLWSNGATTSINNNLCVAGTYELLVTDAQGCTQNTFHTAPLSQPELINVSISGPVSICNTSGPAILTANGGNAGSIYEWSNGATTQSVAVTQSGTYSVSVYGFCYQGQASRTITIREASSTTIDTVVCSNTFTWNGTTYTESGIHIWTGTNTVGCDSVVTLNLTLSPMSITTFDNATPENICFDALYTNCQYSITSNVGGGQAPYSYLWSNGATTSINNNLCVAGTYELLVTDAQGCTQNTFHTAPLSQPELINVSISGPVSICNTSGPAILTANGGNAGSIYDWSNGATTQSVAVTQSGTYSVSVYGFCYQGQASKTITIREASSTTIDTVVCSNTFTWNGTTYTESGIHIWTGTNTVGCDSVVTLNLILSLMSITTFDNTTPENLCNDHIYNTCQLSVGALVSGGTTPYQFAWNTGATSQQINNLCNPGIYSVLVTDATGCTAQGFRLTQMVLPQYLFVSISGPSVLCRNSGPAILVANGGIAGSIYQWSNGATTSVIAVSETGTYSVTVSGICYQGTASKNVTINECRMGESINATSVVLYPNPTKNLVNLLINTTLETQTNIRVTDLLGRVVLEQTEALIAGSNTITYNISDFAKGVYLIQVSNGNEQKVIKLVKE